MGCVSIPFRRLPHQPKLFVRLIDDYSRVQEFYAHPPTLQAVKQVASGLEYPAERRRTARVMAAPAVSTRRPGADPVMWRGSIISPPFL